MRKVNLSEKQARFGDVSRYGYTSKVVPASERVIEQNKRQDKLKLRALRRLAKQGFDEIDRGRFEMVKLRGIAQFMVRIDARSQTRKPR